MNGTEMVTKLSFYEQEIDELRWYLWMKGLL